MHDELIETLRQAQRFGFFGARPIEEAIEHSRSFVAAIGPLVDDARVIDLGSGGGLPGLVIADAYRNIHLVLADRREKRTDFLHRATLRLGFDHVEVRPGDVARIVLAVRAGAEPAFDIVTARGFGPPEATLEMASGLLSTDGAIIISEPPAADRWSPTLLKRLDLRGTRVGAVRVFHRR